MLQPEQEGSQRASVAFVNLAIDAAGLAHLIDRFLVIPVGDLHLCGTQTYRVLEMRAGKGFRPAVQDLSIPMDRFVAALYVALIDDGWIICGVVRNGCGCTGGCPDGRTCRRHRTRGGNLRIRIGQSSDGGRARLRGAGHD